MNRSMPLFSPSPSSPKPAGAGVEVEHGLQIVVAAASARAARPAAVSELEVDPGDLAAVAADRKAAVQAAARPSLRAAR